MKLLIAVCYEIALPNDKTVKGDFHGVRILDSPDDWSDHLSRLSNTALEKSRAYYPDALSVVLTHVHTVRWEE